MLGGHIVELSAEAVVDLRATGIRVRLDSTEHADAMSAAARDLGLVANPGAVLGERIGTADLQAVFGARACYRITSSTQHSELAAAAAALADDAGFPLMVDLRPGLVLIDSGKDQWEGAARQGGRPSSIRSRRRRRR